MPSPPQGGTKCQSRITSNILFVAYGILGGLLPPLILHTVLLPLNIQRLIAMRRLVRQVRAAAESDFNAEWLRPYMRRHSFASGEVIFRKGDEAKDVYYTRIPQVDREFRLRLMPQIAYVPMH